MADFLIRGLDDTTMKALKARAEKNGRSLQAEVKDALKRSVKMTREESIAESRRLLAQFDGKVWPDSTPWIREDRDR
jgi:plasmid stability protein